MKTTPRKKSPTVLVLRTSEKGGVSKNGFKWPKKGRVSCKDWDPKPECGNGLHGLRCGQQDPGVWRDNADSVWQVLEVPLDAIVDLGGKCKFPAARVVLSGSASAVSEYLNNCAPGAWYGATLTGGDYATLTGGYGARLTGGHSARLTGGHSATLTGGDGATLTGGDYATLTGGYGATLTGGSYATLTGGRYARLTGGDGATLTGGDYATLTGGYGATLTGGSCALLRWDLIMSVVVVRVGSDGIEKSVSYKCVDGKAVKA